MIDALSIRIQWYALGASTEHKVVCAAPIDVTLIPSGLLEEWLDALYRCLYRSYVGVIILRVVIPLRYARWNGFWPCDLTTGVIMEEITRFLSM